jgi:hypothetical protein
MLKTGRAIRVAADFTLAWMALLCLFGTSAAVAADKPSVPFPWNGFSCCNLHYENDWLSDGNYAGLPMMVPVGTPITVLSYGRYRANVTVDGKKMRLGQDYGRDQETVDQWVHKIVVEGDPKARIAAYPPKIREAIRQGKVLQGMTKEQAIMAVGYPMTSETPSLDATFWRYWVSSFEEYQLVWGTNGLLKEITGGETVLMRMVYQPDK